jgi:hypothetical protein
MSAKTASIDLVKETGVAQSQPASLPLKRNLTLAYTLSLIAALVMTIASVSGILFRADVYPTDDLNQLPFVDAFNLIAGLPALLGSIWLARRGRLLGLLCWPGALLYVLYRYVASLTDVPFGVMFLPYLLLVTLSAYTLIGLVASIDGEVVRHRLTGLVPARAAGGILIGATVLFAALNIGFVVTGLASQPPVEPDHPLIADFTTLIPACLAGGFLMWRREPLGYVAGAGLLFIYSMLLIGPIPVIALSALAEGAPIPAGDILFLLVIALICLVPFGLFIRGIVRSQLTERNSL